MSNLTEQELTFLFMHELMHAMAEKMWQRELWNISREWLPIWLDTFEDDPYDRED